MRPGLLPTDAATRNERTDYATHKRARDVLAPAVTPREANHIGGIIREVSNWLADECSPQGRSDFEQSA